MGVDQSAAFDCVKHHLLMDKLSVYNIGDDCLEWICSYLTNRTGYVSIGSTDSIMTPMEHGVPQGSVIGPLLYLLYINDLPGTIKDYLCRNTAHDNTTKLFSSNCNECGTLILYVDVSLYVSVNRNRMYNQVKIEENFDRVHHYLNIHGLQINQSKTTLMEFMSKQKRGRLCGIPPELTVLETIQDKTADSQILDSTYCRTLGANLRNSLSWEALLTSGRKAILPSIKRQLGALYSIKNDVKKARLQLTNALIMSKLNYLIPLWG